MANVRTTAPMVAPSSVDPYAEAQVQQALAEALAARGNANAGPAPRTAQAALMNGLNDLIARRASLKAASKASQALGRADRQTGDQNRQLIQAMMQGKGKSMAVDGLDAANPGFDVQLPGKLDPAANDLTQALAGQDPRAVQAMLAQQAMKTAMPDPAEVADREARAAAAQLASDDRREAAAQRERDSIRDAETSLANSAAMAATREQVAAQQAETARQLAAMRDASSAADRELKERLAEQDRALRRQLAEMKIEADRAKAPATTAQESAQAFLSDLGVDQSGDDEVTRLLKVASGGLVDKAIDSGARMINESTEGSRANANLKSIASDKVLDFLGGKLGAGVSNADRDFMMQRAGDIGNENLSNEERMAAWNGIVNRMKSAAGARPGAGATGSFADPAPAASAAPPAGSLKEGVVTKFANGQSWMLQGGKPVRVK